MGLKLPEERQQPENQLAGLFTLIYGEPKIGKSTLASTFPDALFIATEEGLRMLEVYKVSCGDWVTFKDIVRELKKPESKARYKTIVIDTADLLYQACENFICDTKGIGHPSDEDWGKGWSMVRGEFQTGMRHLTAEGYGVVFISHQKMMERNIRGLKVPGIAPSLTNQARKVILPLVDFIFYLSVDVDAPENPGIRRIYCRNTIEFECGTRQKYFPDAIDEISYDGIQEAFLIAKDLEKKEKNNE